MADEIDFENGRISNFQHHVALTLDWAIWHTIVHHSLTSTYTSFESEKLSVDGQTYVRTEGWTDIEAGFIWWTRRSRPNKAAQLVVR